MIALNEEQEQASNHLTGPLLVLAGAGSGKTRVVTTRIAKLIESGIFPHSILGLTFTNKAAKEMQERVKSLTDQAVLISTFHSLGARILRESISCLGYEKDFTIYDAEDSEKVILSCIGDIPSKERKSTLRSLKSMISEAKNSLKSPEDFSLYECRTAIQKLFYKVYFTYQEKLKEYNALDFDDLLFLVVKLLKEHPKVKEHYQTLWKYFLIDEYQDTNHAQYMIAHLLCEKSQNLFVVGDPDQSIYSWRGANIENILNFEEDYPGAKIIRLEQNYRSHPNILNAANALIQNNPNRYEKNLWSDKQQGEKIQLFFAEDDRDETEFVVEKIQQHQESGISLKDIVIFYRTNSQSRIFEDRLLEANIPYKIVGGLSFYQRKEIKDIIAFLRMASSSCDYVSFTRTINLPKRGIGPTTIEKLAKEASQFDAPFFTFVEALVENAIEEHSLKLSVKQKKGLKEYVDLIREIEKIANQESICEAIQYAMSTSGYLAMLKEDQETYQDRKSNLDELINKAASWEEQHPGKTLELFLEELSLTTTLDEAEEKSSLNLMTIHNSKGLEYPIAFMVGMEEELFPHINSKDNTSALEEERRLCYVGMTRAEEVLYMSCARYRYMWGQLKLMRPSRFFKEIPREYTKRSKKETFTFKKEVKTITFEKEDVIFHREFGLGVIKELHESPLGMMYEIFFTKENQKKKILAKTAPIKKL